MHSVSRASLVPLMALSALLGLANPALCADRTPGSGVESAVGVAREKFARRLADERSGRALSRDEDLLSFLMNPDNYDVGVSQTMDLYIVVFLPRRIPPFENVVGGGGVYYIRKSDLAVIRFAGYE